MAQAYTAPTWTDGSGEGISASNLQAISNALQGIVQGTDKAIHNIAINGSTITFTFVDGTIETAQAVNLKGISSVEKTSTSGRVDTYTITFTDGTTSTFTVTNGEQGYDDLAYHVDADLITDVGNNDYIPIYSTIQSTSGEKQITISDLKRNIVTPVVSGKADLTLIAPVQTTLTASKAYAVGEQFVYNQVLYKVTQAIAQGAQITIGTNAVLAGSVTEQHLKYIDIDYSGTIVNDQDQGQYYKAITITSQFPTGAQPVNVIYLGGYDGCIRFGLFVNDDLSYIGLILFSTKLYTVPTNRKARIFYYI
jgi:hypothetical protein